MILKEIIEKMGFRVLAGRDSLDVEVKYGYVSDLLSDVMGNAREGDLWVTMQIHKNVVAVAVMKSIAGIILVNNREPEEDTLKKAAEENLPIIQTDMPAFEVVGRLYGLGITGSGN
jgi:predicted transcriptional regulator